jgi:serine protease Do
MDHDISSLSRLGMAMLLLIGAVVRAPTLTAADSVDADVLEAQQRRIDAIQRGLPAAVSIFAGEAGGGAGVLISADGYALTNYHVVQPAGVAMQCGLPDGKLYDAVLVGLDPTGDVALIKLIGRDDFPHAVLADSDLVEVGDFCFAAGNPFLLATDLQPSVSVGIVSGVHRYQFPAGTILEYTDCLQVDAAINPGNSGGGLFDVAGQIIGVNGRASFEKRGRVNVGVGYAISANQLRNFLGSLKGGRLVDHATLGATVATSADGRVVVSDILERSDAFRRGLRYDDEIVALMDRPVRTVNAFKNILGTLPAGWQVPLTYRRSGRRVDTLVRLAGVQTRGD